MENLKLNDFLDYRYLSGIELSPDKNYGAFVVHKADPDENKYLSNIWIYNRDDSECRKLTSMDNEKNFICA
jgi:acylaminoacyl-peptidase